MSQPTDPRPAGTRETPAAPIRVVLVDDHTIMRDGIKALLRCAPDVQVVGEAADGREGVGVVTRTRPDIVLLDLDMPVLGGEETMAELMKLPRPPRVLILTMHTEEERLVPLLESGAQGFLSKDAASGELVNAIRAVARGEVYVRPRVARLLATGVRAAAGTAPAETARAKLGRLSDRERSVLQLTAEGYNGPEIGRILGITAKTVDTYKHRIEEKLGLAHRIDYVRFALTAGILAA